MKSIAIFFLFPANNIIIGIVNMAIKTEPLEYVKNIAVKINTVVEMSNIFLFFPKYKLFCSNEITMINTITRNNARGTESPNVPMPAPCSRPPANPSVNNLKVACLPPISRELPRGYQKSEIPLKC